MSFKDMAGLRQGHLLVIGRGENVPGSSRARWICKCDCGNVVTMRGDVLRSGSSSCGCMSGYKHGGCSGGKLSGLYITWRDMRARCNRPDNVGYSLYGGRGIKVCSEWESNFSSFQEWALSHGYRKGLTIDRIDPDGSYEPGNCRWATNAEQQTNKRNTTYVEFRGERRPLTVVAKENGIHPQTLHKVVKRGENVEEWLKRRNALKNNNILEDF